MNLSRREWLISAGAFAISAPSFARTSNRAVLGESDELLPNARGGYRFLPGPPFLSFATLASDGFEIVPATLVRPRLYPEGLTTIGGLRRMSGYRASSSPRQATPFCRLPQCILVEEERR